MTFYTDMQDTASTLIQRYGMTMSLYQQFKAYDPSSGSMTLSPGQDVLTSIYALRLPIERPKLRNIFRDETVNRASWQFVVSGKELVAAGVTPNVDDVIIMNGVNYQIIDILKITPGGTDVIYKILVEG